MVKALEILSSWVAFYNPTQEQLEIAHHRAAVCDLCDAKVELEESVIQDYIAHKFLTKENSILAKFKCSACGCSLAGKIFSPLTPKDEVCPRNKWLY